MNDQTTPKSTLPTKASTEIKTTVSNGFFITRNPNTHETISMTACPDGKVELWVTSGNDMTQIWLTEAQVEAMTRFFNYEV